MKVAVCIPCYGDPKARFVQSLVGMISHFYRANITGLDGEPLERQLEVFMVSCSLLTEGRHQLVAQALSWGADYILWCDADHTFPEDALARLWAHNLPVVGCNYSRRCWPTAPTAALTVDDEDDTKNLVYTTIEKAQAGLLEKVDHLGFGLCLMDKRVFDQLQIDAEERGEKSFLPLFRFETRADGFGVIGEDVFFFRKLRLAGIDVMCDHGLSWEVGHIHEVQVTAGMAVAQRQKWGESIKRSQERLEQRAKELEDG